MSSLTPTWAVVLRHVRLLRRDPNVVLWVFYWPVLDVFIWGFLGAWISRSHVVQFQHYEVIALLGILLWQMIGRGGNVILVSLAEELWSGNVINVFSLPIAISEWIVGVVMYYAIMNGITVVFCMSIIALLYDVSMWDIIRNYLIFALPLFLSGIWLGFTCLQILIMLGRRGIEFGYVLIWFLLPFSGAYYPIDVLPVWGQKISALFPMSYVFNGMRAYIEHNQDPLPCIIKGSVLGGVYAVCAIVGFVYCFNRSKRHGLARLID